MTISPPPTPVSDLFAYAANQGHPDYPCLSRTHAPSSCVPCADFSPWLRERVARGDVDAVAEYLYRMREANPGLGESIEGLRANYAQLAERILTAPLDRYLRQGDEAAYLDLKVSLLMLAVHEAFSGFIMTGEAADFVASVMAPHPLLVCDANELIESRNGFVQEMAKEMSYWAAWPMLEPGSLPPVAPPEAPELRRLLDVLLTLPLGARAHAIDAIRHLSAHPHVPKTLASLSRYETRKRGLDVQTSSQLILQSGLVVRATDLDGWLGSWTRRDLLGFLAQSGVGARNSWGKERLAEVAKTECAQLLYTRMDDAGVVELATEHVEGARLLREHVESTRECWRVWLAFGTGVADR